MDQGDGVVSERDRLAVRSEQCNVPRIDSPQDRECPEISVVIPVYNSQETVNELCDRLQSSLTALNVTYEVLFVDDGSRDRSAERLAERARANSAFRLVKMIRNFGQHQALTAGMSLARGRWIVVMDDDLQNPPEEIHKLYHKALEGYDVVYGDRGRRADSWLRRTVSSFARWLFCRLFGAQPADAVSAFRILSRRVVDEYVRLRERHTYVAALITWMGFPDASVPVQHDSRKVGQSNYSLRKLGRIWFNIAFAFSDRPLQIATWIGGVFTAGAFLIFSRAIVNYFAADEPLGGYSTLLASQMFFCGITLLGLGIVGEYLARIYHEVKQRPYYILDRQGSVPQLPSYSEERTLT